MDPKLMWMIVILGAAVVVAGLWFVVEKRRRLRLRQRFGPEYERAVHEAGSERRAEAALDARTRRVARLQIRPLSEADAVRFAEAWRVLQTRFVDEPATAIAEADRLVGEVMTARGYPLGDFDQRAADISIDHPHVVANYRAARDIAQRQGRGEASTEDLRQAIIHYRALFEDLLERHDITEQKPAVQDDRELVGGRR
jgi:hypothetical protein